MKTRQFTVGLWGLLASSLFASYCQAAVSLAGYTFVSDMNCRGAGLWHRVDAPASWNQSDDYCHPIFEFRYDGRFVYDSRNGRDEKIVGTYRVNTHGAAPVVELTFPGHGGSFFSFSLDLDSNKEPSRICAGRPFSECWRFYTYHSLPGRVAGLLSTRPGEKYTLYLSNGKSEFAFTTSGNEVAEIGRLGTVRGIVDYRVQGSRYIKNYNFLLKYELSTPLPGDPIRRVHGKVSRVDGGYKFVAACPPIEGKTLALTPLNENMADVLDSLVDNAADDSPATAWLSGYFGKVDGKETLEVLDVARTEKQAEAFELVHEKSGRFMIGADGTTVYFVSGQKQYRVDYLVNGLRVSLIRQIRPLLSAGKQPVGTVSGLEAVDAAGTAVLGAVRFTLNRS